MATTSFSLGEEWDAYLAGKVASGDFKTKAEVVRNALRNERLREAQHASLIAYVQEGIDSGLSEKGLDDIFADVKTRGRRLAGKQAS